jgi:DNA excision repair protein ERCC-2
MLSPASDDATKLIAIDVRDFAIPIPRKGSIEPGSGYGLSIASAMGVAVHKRIQQEKKEVNPNYRAEVKISHSFAAEKYRFQISGRIDGLFELIQKSECDQAPQIKIEEIKTAFSTEHLCRILQADPEHPYSLQVRTYAYLYWKQTGVLPSCSILIASLLNKSDARTIEIPFDLDLFEQWFQRRTSSLIIELQFQEKDYKRRKRLAKILQFPFERARPGQEQLIDHVDRVLASGKPILVQAPTGLGKTMAILYPALRDSLKRGQRLIYCTPKNSLHLVAENAVDKLREQKIPIRSLTLTAKAKLCMLPEPICDPKVCQYARDHYSKVAEHNLLDVMSQHSELTPQLFQEYAEKFKVCPFELSIDCIDRADIVICDYNHVFAPISLSGRLTAPALQKSQRANLIIDEAHNLHSRASGYFSASLSTSALKQHRTTLLSFQREWSILADQCIALLDRISAGQIGRQSEIKLDPSEFLRLNDRINSLLFTSLESSTNVEQLGHLMQFSRYWSEFAAAIAQSDYEHFTTLTKADDSVCIKVTCCDASALLRQHYQLFQNVIAFSATLKPFKYYSQLSGFDSDTIELMEAASPFPKSNRKMLVIPQVSTKYKDRQANYQKITDAVCKIVSVKPANYILFFPSFEFLEQISRRMPDCGLTKLIQKRSMTRKEVVDVLDTMRESRTCILFAVQGGIFAEGVDFCGNMAEGAIIIGPGLPSFDLERELLRDYFERTYGAGFDYAYTYPAMTKIIQSAGRVIRSEQDRGLIVLMDQRFTSAPYTRAMPADWFEESIEELVSTSILKDIKNFWQAGAEASTEQQTGVRNV